MDEGAALDTAPDTVLDTALERKASTGRVSGGHSRRPACTTPVGAAAAATGGMSSAVSSVAVEEEPSATAGGLAHGRHVAVPSV